MRRIGLLVLTMVFTASLLAGTSYYVDSVNGNDTNNGLSEGSAWRTLNRIRSQSFSPGDRILLKRASVWRENLVIDNVIGSASAAITFGAYGTGVKPQINGAAVSTGWSRHSGSIYQKSFPGDAGVVVEDGSLLSWLKWQGSVSSTFSGASAGCWSCNESSNTTYVWCTNSADPDTHTMQVAAKLRDGSREYGIRMRRASYVIIQDIEIVNTTHTGILVTPPSGHTMNGVIIRRLTVRNNGMTGIEVNNSANSGAATREIANLLIANCIVHDTNYHGIILAFGVEGAVIRNNIVYRTGYLRLGAHGITTWSNNPNAYVHDCTIEGNTVHHSISCNEGIEGTGIHADNYSRNNLYRYNLAYANEGSGFYNGRLTSGCKFYYNIGYRNGTAGVDPYRGGITLAEPQNVRVCNNTFYDNYPCGICWFGDTTDGVTLKNNILCDNVDYEIKSGVNADRNVSSDYNCVYHPSGGRFMKWVGSDSTWTEWLNRSGKDSHSLNADPRFVSASNKNFNLQSSSPCVDAGTNLGLPKDYNGNSVAQGDGVDIGACEYVSSASPLSIDASGSPTSGTAPLAVSFSGSASGGTSPYSYRWTFGDGSSSTVQNPSHTYSETGTYTATLTVTDNDSQQESASVGINVTNNAMSITIDASPSSGQPPLEVSFSRNISGGAGPYSYNWNFGDGGTSTAANPTHTYTTSGAYTATLTVTDNGGQQDTDSITISVDDLPELQVGITAQPTSGQIPLTVQFTRNVSGGVSPFSYLWNFGDGNTSTINNPEHTFTSAGSYTVTLTVTDDAGQEESATQTINATDTPELSASMTADPSSGQPPLSVSFSGGASGGASPYIYHWTFGDGGSSSAQNPSHTYNSPGTYTATLTVTDDGGQEASDSGTITVEDLPELNVGISASPTSGYIPLTVQFTRNVSGGVSPFAYHWDFGDGGTSTINNPSYTFTSAGSYTVTLTVTDDAGQQESATKSIDATEPASLNASGEASPTSGVVPLTVNFTGNAAGGSPPYSYSWDFGDGGTSTAQNPSHTYSQKGNYNVSLTVTDSQSRQDSATGKITVFAQNSQFILSMSSSTGAPAQGSGGTVDPPAGDHDYASGTSVQITAAPETNFRFSRWTGNVPNAIVGSSQIDLTMNEDKSVTAKFCSKCGDVNGDLTITPTDAQLIFEIFLGIIADPTPCQLENSDVNCDGTKADPNVTPSDAQAIFDFYLGKAALPGDCSCNTRAASSASSFRTQGRQAKDFNLFVPDIHATGERMIFVPVSIDRPIRCDAFGIDFQYDSSRLEFLSAARTDITEDFRQVDGRVLKKDLLRVGGYREKSSEKILPGELVVLIFKVKKGKTPPPAIHITAAYDDLKTESGATGITAPGL